MGNNHFLKEEIVITNENIQQYVDILNEYSPVELVDLIQNKSKDEQFLIFSSLSPKQAANVFDYLSLGLQKKILKKLPCQQIATLLDQIAPDDRTAILSELPKETVNQLLQYLSPKERAISIKLLGYPEGSIGRLMTPDYIAVKMDWTVKQVLDYVREKGRDSETVNVIYAVDDQGKLLDDFRIRQFLFASPEAKVKDLSDGKFIALKVEESQEQALQDFRRYYRVALPVVDAKGYMLGIVTVDDIVDVAVEEDTKDMQQIGGVATFKESYMSIPFLDLMKKRLGWLTMLFLGEMLTASAMGFFQGDIAKAVVLALFLPLIISSGGNAGSQASSLIIRALALREVRLRDWWKVMRREIFSGIFLGVFLGTIGFFRVSLWSILFGMYGPEWFLVAVTVFFALIGVVLWGTLAGAMLPLLLKKCNFDPAVSSAPFVATLVDVTGVIIYFSIALVVLRGTLL